MKWNNENKTVIKNLMGKNLIPKQSLLEIMKMNGGKISLMHMFIIHGSHCSSIECQLEISSFSALSLITIYQFKSAITTDPSPAGELLVQGKIFYH